MSESVPPTNSDESRRKWKSPTISGHIYYPPAHAEECQRIADILERPFLHDDEVTLLERFHAQDIQLKLKRLTSIHHHILYDLYFKCPLIAPIPDYVPQPPRRIAAITDFGSLVFATPAPAPPSITGPS
ncbi:hypothetical protein SCLCIDRAFT_23541 [Scleroderma citrinum Foug A]|uniref:Uncharacterized protein n=1 Tax=Scleroderma citrinum Foug A TaxID=1036808 RepID=A0A0C3E9A2_9AGAM|nr:hypothetical protein SCLCIDRAFT_23541 [Scleroderma citrinum Foug A]